MVQEIICLIDTFMGNNNMSLNASIKPFFKLNIMMVVSDYNKLLGYESRLHALGHDTMNCPN